LRRFIGVVTATKKHPAKADAAIGEYRVSVQPAGLLADSRQPERDLVAADRFCGRREMSATAQTTKAVPVKGRLLRIRISSTGKQSEPRNSAFITRRRSTARGPSEWATPTLSAYRRRLAKVRFPRFCDGSCLRIGAPRVLLRMFAAKNSQKRACSRDSALWSNVGICVR
jgi:hypothetical protein